MKSAKLKLVKRTDLRTVAGRKANDAYRTREHLTESEMAKLLAALKANRHGNRDWLIGLMIYRHGLRVSEACDCGGTISIYRSAPLPSAGSRAPPTACITSNAMNWLASSDCSGSKSRRQPMCSPASAGSPSVAWALAG